MEASFSRQVLDGLPVPVYAVDRDGLLTYFNAAAAEFAGRQPVLGSDRWWIAERLVSAGGETIDPVDGPLARSLREDREIRGFEAFAERRDGTRIAFSSTPTLLRGPDGAVTGAMDVLIDIGPRRDSERRVEFMCSHDPLTGLPNRASLAGRLSAATGAADAEDAGFAVLAVDIDGLADVNETYGHDTGDHILRETARLLSEQAEGAFVGRADSDGFVIICPAGTGRMEVLDLVDRIHAAVAGAGRYGRQRCTVGAGIGCAFFPADGRDPETLLAAASTALQQAKADGWNGLSFFDASVDRELRERHILLRDLRHAIQFGALELHYQPQLGSGGAVIGFEALARWPHPSRGMIGPDRFIPLAEEYGAIQDLTEWTLVEACREAASWRFPLTVSVNISPTEFRHGDLASLVHSTLLRTGFSPARLELEITENVMIEDFNKALSILRRLRGLGVKLALDDFGTGYSSLSYLETFPFTRLKVDRSFTANIGRKSESAAIVRSAIGLAHALGLSVTAEGVERQEQLDFLLREGCDAIQGYLIGRPRDIATYAEMTGEQGFRRSA